MKDRLTPEAALAHGEGRKIRVLLADDDEGIRNALAALLADAGEIEVVGEAANGLEALELSRTTRPDVVVMDLSMPVMDGVEATRRILPEIPEVRVIALSAHDDPYHADRMRGAGAAAFVTKTAPLDHLVATIRGQSAPG